MRESSPYLLYMFLAIFVMSGCTSAPTKTPTQVPTSTPIPPTFTPSPIPPTFTPEPTATSTPVPPSPTLATPTPSGKFEFFDVSLAQAAKDTVNISFSYQLKQGLESNGLQIIADFLTKDFSRSCGNQIITLNAYPYFLKGEVSGIVNGAKAVSLIMAEPAKCSFEGFTLKVIRQTNPSYVTLYKQDFEIPFTLEK